MVSPLASKQKRLHTIAVIGGGIGGLASAILFARQGLAVTVYEQAAKPQAVGAGFLLQPPGQRVLDELGVLPDVLKHAVPIDGLRSETQSGHTILDLKYQDLKGGNRHGLGVQRSTIYDALYCKAKRDDAIEFRWGSKVEKLDLEADRVTVITRDHSATFDLCILSSGANSQLADEYFPHRRSQVYPWGCLWTTVKLPPSFSPSLLHQRCHQATRMMGLLPILKTEQGHQAALYWSAKFNDIAKLDPEQFAAIKHDMVAFWPEAEAAIAPLVQDDFVAAKYRDVWIRKPYTGRLIAIGDVCHATSPQLGQGCTMALLDASWLAHNLQSHQGELDKALSQWWQYRKPQLRYVRHLSRWLTPLYQSDNRLHSLFRDTLVAPSGRLPWLYQLQLKTLASDIFLKERSE